MTQVAAITHLYLLRIGSFTVNRRKRARLLSMYSGSKVRHDRGKAGKRVSVTQAEGTGHGRVLEGPLKPKGQSLVKRPSKHPQGSVANQILTVDRQRANASGGGSTMMMKKRPAFAALVCLLRQYVTTNKRLAAIGGANAHSNPDRLSFVTSFTVSNDTHCFWTPSSSSTWY